ncbi:mitochondrial import inner membrane translocase subunit Tim29 [Brienomyrus brachyistius]|uniref:mitochondrial import inner membrane translocase subunit Tim29 n=1 Tax=Brienomyrus brachyistius TaxID=42636 RepID=UPI0020B26C33|nr:mitochondrial import inner membrane translocase subunit Tim29 [Brienomyrus brachyistius]
MAASRVFRRWCSSAPQAKVTRWERLRNSRVGVWCSSLLSDYREACREVIVGAYQQPFKASIYLGLLGGAWACYHTNPDDASFETSLLETANKLGLLSPWIRNGSSDGHMQDLLRLRNQGRLRYLSLGVASLAYRVDYDPAASLYEAHSSALFVPWAELPGRVLDVGFAGRWWVLDTRMKDYDVNEEEFRHMAPALATTQPPNAQETERNQRLHQESWRALEMSAEDVEQAEREKEERKAAGQPQL